MSIETDFRALLAGHAGTAALVAGRIAHNAAPEGSAYPLIVFNAQHDRQFGLDNTLLADQCTLTVQCWAATAVTADAVADQVIAALTLAPPFAGAVALTRTSAHDPELGLDGTVLTVEWWA